MRGHTCISLSSISLCPCVFKHKFSVLIMCAHPKNRHQSESSLLVGNESHIEPACQRWRAEPSVLRTGTRNTLVQHCAACEYRRFNLDKTFSSYHLSCLHRLQISALNLLDAIFKRLQQSSFAISDHYRPTIGLYPLRPSGPISRLVGKPRPLRSHLEREKNNSFGSEFG